MKATWEGGIGVPKIKCCKCEKENKENLWRTTEMIRKHLLDEHGEVGDL